MLPSSTYSRTTIEPHHLQIEPPAYATAPYLNSPPLSYHDSSPTSPDTPCRSIRQHPPTFNNPTSLDHLPPTTPGRPSFSSEPDDEDVPLAQLLLQTREAPPAYSAVVQQPYRETLLQHIPRHPVVVDFDEEAAFEWMRADDVRFTVERVVAMAVVIAVLVIAGVWMIHVILQSQGHYWL